MTFQFFKGDKVYLRAMEPEDFQEIYTMENDPEMWDVSNFTVPYSKYHIKEYITNSKCDMFADMQLRMIIAENGTDEVIGTVDVFDFAPLHRRAELGIAIKKQYRGKGCSKEALLLMRDYLFGFLHFSQLTARVTADNEASLRLFKACGFVECGLLRKWWYVGKEVKDVVLLQCLNESY